jgi:hypothetical protein
MNVILGFSHCRSVMDKCILRVLFLYFYLHVELKRQWLEEKAL